MARAMIRRESLNKKDFGDHCTPLWEDVLVDAQRCRDVYILCALGTDIIGVHPRIGRKQKRSEITGDLTPLLAIRDDNRIGTDVF
jgi:hypothetical protein